MTLGASSQLVAKLGRVIERGQPIYTRQIVSRLLKQPDKQFTAAPHPSTWTWIHINFFEIGPR
jgi:hypothetical protein